MLAPSRKCQRGQSRNKTHSVADMYTQMVRTHNVRDTSMVDPVGQVPDLVGHKVGAAVADTHAIELADVETDC